MILNDEIVIAALLPQSLWFFVSEIRLIFGESKTANYASYEFDSV